MKSVMYFLAMVLIYAFEVFLDVKEVHGNNDMPPEERLVTFCIKDRLQKQY